jgi:broad specificity phosphatase PhoE
MCRLPTRAFYFLRHGETDWNRQGLAQGSTDVPLNQTGIAQARAASLLLRERAISSIVSSPLQRALVTAEIVAGELALDVATNADLREVSFGIDEGKSLSADWHIGWIQGTYTPPGGESFAGLRARAVDAFVQELERKPAVLIVGHGALFRAVRAEMGLVPHIRPPNAVPLFCQPGPPWSVTSV